MIKTAQQNFDSTYVTSSEIQTRLNVAKAQVTHAVTSGRLPESMVVGPNRIRLWLREDVEHHLTDWGDALARYRNR